MARYYRQRGYPVRLHTGTDEHGIKMVKTAKELGMSPQELADENSDKFRATKELFDISFDSFIRTTDAEHHWPSVVKIWEKLVAKGDLYEKEYEGLYCYGCEEFKQEKDLVEGKCVNHNRAPERVKEKNWFFRLSKYSDAILQKLESREMAILPAFRATEIINFVKGGLTDVSFSRPRSSLTWGIPVPGDATQVMYVWCDALTHYISALDYAGESEDMRKWWPAEVQCIGKDIVRFHAGVWLGMLMSAELPLPRSMYVHGFVTSEGQKMSKSLGNVVDPVVVAEEWGVDALRYYLLSEIPNGQDGDFSAVRFRDKYQGELGNALGNLVSRTVAMVWKAYPDGVFPMPALDSALLPDPFPAVDAAMTDYDFRTALLGIWDAAAWANKHIEENKPWSLKEERGKQAVVFGNLLVVLSRIAVALYPFLPTASEKIGHMLGVAVDTVGTGEVPAAYQLAAGGILFPRKE